MVPYRLAMARPSAVILLGGIFSLANGCFVVGSMSLPGATTPWKSPLLSAPFGMVRDLAPANCRMYFHSWPTKKNSLSRLIGPPTFHPKSLNLSAGLGTTSLPSRGSPDATITLGALAAGSLVKRPLALLKKLL